MGLPRTVMLHGTALPDRTIVSQRTVMPHGTAGMAGTLGMVGRVRETVGMVRGLAQVVGVVAMAAGRLGDHWIPFPMGLVVMPGRPVMIPGPVATSTAR
jgi:hypothetical protein